jgi:hypothetical protein
MDHRSFERRRHVGLPGSVSWLLHHVRRRPYGKRRSDVPSLPPDEEARPLDWPTVVLVLLDELGVKALAAGAAALLLRWLAQHLGVATP